MKILCVVGARPNFMKIAPLIPALRQHGGMEPVLVHTGQHYDARMSELFFEQLGIPRPDVNLGIGSGSHAVQTAGVMTAFEPVLAAHKPRAVLVVGDVNSTIACGMVAVKMGVSLVHVEAGLRSFDRSMPEEINRVLTDAISDLLFCTESSAVQNLKREGVDDSRIFLVGNVMIDTLLANRAKASGSSILRDLGLQERRYAVLTLHRPANVESPEVLTGLVEALEQIQQDMPVVFPVHPRTRSRLCAGPLEGRLRKMSGLKLIEPAGYLDFLHLMSQARAVLTDSGGIQEETTILHVPCLTLRQSTERPVTAIMGSNRVVGTRPGAIIEAWKETLDGPPTTTQTPPLWDGEAAVRIASILNQKLAH